MNEAAILASVNSITNRGLSSITSELKTALVEISCRTLSIKKTATGNTVSGQNYIDKPADMAATAIFCLKANDIQLDPIPWADFRNNVKGYCLYNNRIYIYPTPSGEAYILDYAGKHPDSTATIYLDDIYEQAVIRRVCSLVYANIPELQKEFKTQLGLYEREMSLYSGYNSTPPICRPYKGI